MDSTHTMSGAGRQILLGVVSGLSVLIAGSSTGDRHQRAHLAQILDTLESAVFLVDLCLGIRQCQVTALAHPCVWVSTG
jgi:hypothetical protein